MKICNKCNNDLPLEAFTKNASRPFGVADICRNCDAARRKEKVDATRIAQQSQIDGTELCHMGCGQPGLFKHLKTGLLRCSENNSSCPTISKRKRDLGAKHRVVRLAAEADFLTHPQPCKCGAMGVHFNKRTKEWRCVTKDNRCPNDIAKWEATMLERHGTTVMAHIPGVQELRSVILKAQHAARGKDGRKVIDLKRQDTMFERTGYRNAGQIPENRENIKANNLIKYGVGHTLQVSKFREQGRHTMLTIYGVDHPLKCAEIIEKKRLTTLGRWGCDNPMQNATVNAKRIETNIELYGGASPMADAAVFEKQQRAMFRLKEYVFPSGRIVSVQGYEPTALNFLLEEGIEEDEIVVDPSLMPVIHWYDTAGKKHRYYPDIYVPSCSYIIEVKSPYTMSVCMEMNLAKQAATIAAGYNFTFLIFDKGKLISII